MTKNRVKYYQIWQKQLRNKENLTRTYMKLNVVPVLDYKHSLKIFIGY